MCRAYCNRMKSYDIIGDIHGRYDKLRALLLGLGYREDGEGFVPPAGSRALFLGDLIDPKPGFPSPGGTKRVLETVKAMVDRGDAEVVMGNHEFNAICYHTRGPDGKWLRIRGTGNRKNHGGTLEDFPDWEDPEGEWLARWIPWLKTLPLRLDLGGLRAIHACWHPEHFDVLRERSLEDYDFLVACADKKSPEGKAIEVLLKGIEVPMPEPHYFFDHAGTKRHHFRARWWERPDGTLNCRQLVFPEDPGFPQEPVGEAAYDLFQPYPEDDPPVFFGHYFKPAESPLRPERKNVACLDHSAAKDGPLVAYCWRGEARLNLSHYRTHEN